MPAQVGGGGPSRSVVADEAHEAALDLHLGGVEVLGLVGGVRRLERDAAVATAQALERGLLVAHEGDDDVAVVAGGAFPGLTGMDLARTVTTAQSYRWDEAKWAWPGGHAAAPEMPRRNVVAVDYGAKRNILRSLVHVGCDVTVLPATATAEEILALAPDGVFLSNGPGDPAATGEYAVPAIRGVIEAEVPVFGICLGHQMLALALGGRTVKMNHGHHGANHPVKDVTTGKVEITSMNHGFAVDAQTLPKGVNETHVSLFDGSNCGLAVEGKPIFSVQYHPEASPGPHDSAYLFDRFRAAMDERAEGTQAAQA